MDIEQDKSMQLKTRVYCPKVDVIKLCGGGTMWYYALCKCGKVLGAAHEDDKEGMFRLAEIKGHKK